MVPTVLDPRIMYEGLKSDYTSDPSLLHDLDEAKSKLKTFYQQNYARFSQRLSQTRSLSTVSSRNSSIVGSPEKVNFTSRYQLKDRIAVDELEEYFKQPREDFDSCKPLKWWLGRRSQFPNMYRLVCDVFSIPGMSFCCWPGGLCILAATDICAILRLCCSRRTHFLWWPRYNLFTSSQSKTRYHPSPHVGQAAPPTRTYYVAEG